MFRFETIRAIGAAAALLLVMTGCTPGSSADADPSDSATVPTTLPGRGTTTSVAPAPGSTTTTIDPNAPGEIHERPSAVRLAGSTEKVRHLHREFLQSTNGITFGPDGLLYVADPLGRHVVRVAEDGSMDDLGLWRAGWFDEEGPEDLAFDSDGRLYVVSGERILRVGPDGQVEELDGIEGSPVGGIVFDPDGTLFYSDRGTGEVRRLNPDGSSDVVIAGLPGAKALATGPDGTLLVAQETEHRFAQVDPRSGEIREFVFGLELEGEPKRAVAAFGDPSGAIVTADGDVWIIGLRGGSALYRVGPDGVPVPFMVDGAGYHRNAFSAQGVCHSMALDDRDRLWIACFDGGLKRLDPVSTGGGVPEYAFTTVRGGFGGQIALAPDGTLYSTVRDRKELVAFDADGAMRTIAEFAERPWAVAVAPDGTPFVGLETDIVYLEADGSVVETGAGVSPGRLAFGTDGELYASVTVDEVTLRTHIIRVSTDGASEPLLTEADGIRMASEVHLSRMPGEGLYLFDELQGNVFTMGVDGSTEYVLDLKPIGAFYPAAFAASPVSGDLFVGLEVVPHKYLYRVDLDGNVELMATGITGDPSSAVVSPDGRWLYVRELGAIDVFRIHETPVHATEASVLPTSTTSTTTTTLAPGTVSSEARGAICDAYLAFSGAHNPDDRAGPLAIIGESAGSGAPAGLDEALEVLATADYRSTNVGPQLGTLSGYVLPLCEEIYNAGVVGAADDETAATLFWESLVRGDRDAVAHIASALTIASFAPWDGYDGDSGYLLYDFTDGLLWMQLSADVSLACQVSDGIVHSCQR